MLWWFSCGSSLWSDECAAQIVRAMAFRPTSAQPVAQRIPDQRFLMGMNFTRALCKRHIRLMAATALPWLPSAAFADGGTISFQGAVSAAPFQVTVSAAPVARTIGATLAPGASDATTVTFTAVLNSTPLATVVVAPISAKYAAAGVPATVVTSSSFSDPMGHTVAADRFGRFHPPASGGNLSFGFAPSRTRKSAVVVTSYI
jgi:hypothetical protein